MGFFGVDMYVMRMVCVNVSICEEKTCIYILIYEKKKLVDDVAIIYKFFFYYWVDMYVMRMVVSESRWNNKTSCCSFLLLLKYG